MMKREIAIETIKELKDNRMLDYNYRQALLVAYNEMSHRSNKEVSGISKEQVSEAEFEKLKDRFENLMWVVGCITVALQDKNIIDEREREDIVSGTYQESNCYVPMGGTEQ